MAVIELETAVPASAPDLETVTPLRPSEALRLGRLLRPRQVFGPAFDGADGACAWACIVKASPPLMGGFGYGGDPVCPAPLIRTRRFFGLVRKSVPAFWRCLCATSVDSTVTHLNDDHHWSDDQIVTWLESLGL